MIEHILYNFFIGLCIGYTFIDIIIKSIRQYKNMKINKNNNKIISELNKLEEKIK